MTARPDNDRDLRNLWQPFVKDVPHEDLRPALDQRWAAVPTRRRRHWTRRFGPPAGLAVGLLAVAGAATATGVISFGGLAGTTSHDDTSATKDLRTLISQLEPVAGGERATRTGTVKLDGLEVVVALNDRRLCFSAPGDHAVGRDDKLRKDDFTRTLPRLEDVPQAVQLRKRPMQVACVDVSRLDEQLPVISGTDERGSWVIALAPDQVTGVEAMTDGDGGPVELQKSRNLAVGRSRSPFTRVRWRTADGKSRTSSVSTK